MQKIALFLNGEKPQTLPNLNEYAAVYCTDGAYDFLNSHNIVPNFISGDFDSIKELPQEITTVHTPDQNFTDFDKALTLIKSHGHTHIDVFAGSGLEQDHFLGNLSTALKHKNTACIRFYDDRQCYYFLDKENTINAVKDKTISLYPFPKATCVTSTGLQYPLNKLTLSIKKHRIGTRNHAIEENISLTFKRGNLLIFIAHTKQ